MHRDGDGDGDGDAGGGECVGAPRPPGRVGFGGRVGAGRRWQSRVAERAAAAGDTHLEEGEGGGKPRAR